MGVEVGFGGDGLKAGGRWLEANVSQSQSKGGTETHIENRLAV